MSGIIVYHHAVPWMVQKAGKSKEALGSVVRNLSHDSFLNLRLAVDEETKRREKNDPPKD